MTSDAKDNELLMNLGYKPELRRNFSPLEVFGISFSIMSLIPSIATTLDLGLPGGGVGLTWGWFVPSIFIFSVGVSLSELGSAMPTSGGLYWWTYKFSPPSIPKSSCWFIGYANTFGLIGGICSIDYGFANMVLSIPSMATGEDWSSTKYMTYGVFVFGVVSQIVVGLVTTKLMAKLQTFCIFLNCVLMGIILIGLPVGLLHKGGKLNDAKFVFGNTDNFYTGWEYGWSFMLSWMACIWTIGAFDSCIHMAEEASNAASAVPLGINLSIALCGILGWVCMCVFAAVVNPDIEAVLNSPTGTSFAQVVLDCLGKKWAIAIEVITAITSWLMGLSILVATSRQTWSFSRDGALPFSRWIKKINHNNGVPWAALIFDGVATILLGLLMLINETAANALFSLNVASNAIAWLAPIFWRAWYGSSASFVPGPFYLGEFWSRVNNIIASIYLIFTTFVLSMIPLERPVNAQNMNYTVVVNMAVWIGSLIYYWVDGHKWFEGPKLTLETIEGEEGQLPPIDSVVVNMPKEGEVREVGSNSSSTGHSNEKNVQPVSTLAIQDGQ